ncbi:hypothetical protein [Actinoplanes sp. NPDC051411]|uniref:hypothetical protein n=1 Tax=Actinoplanes sp. NPDC051411 TaxID=3155522 RepID=UPI003443CD38
MSTLIEAGAILPGPPTAADLDTVTARSYQHPVLDGRTVVRLIGGTVGPAEDLSMEFLGFAPAAEPVEVGHARRQALGFPAWALVHDPANGRHALALVKEMEKLARVARQKPGNAKDGYDALAERLGAAAPQFLPTFWEQAGRAYLAAGNQRMAGTCFTAARRAEEVHGLTVDEDRVRDVHLEFAFAGALTAAMLTAYARGAADRRPAPEAYALVKTLALRRVAGGLPPHTSMATDLARLAKAAGLDAEREADEVAGRLLTYPAMLRSHPSVWKSYRKVLVRLGKRDGAVRSRLLEVLPEPPGYGTDMSEQWLELLDAAGAFSDEAAWPGGSAGAWLQRFLRARRAPRSVRLLQLVERMLPRLAAEGGVFAGEHPRSVNLDVLDLCRAAGIPVPLQPVPDWFHVAGWARDGNPGRRDLAALAADPALRPYLARGVRHAVTQLHGDRSLTGTPLPSATLREAFGAAGVRDVLSELLASVTARAGDSTVTDLDEDLSFLAAVWSPEGMAFAPDGFRRLTSIDVAAVLARTLRGGLGAELGWPAYDRVTAQLKNVRFGVSWPELVVHDERTAFVIRPDGEITEHVFRLPPAGHPKAPTSYSTTGCLYADGELLVVWRSEGGTVGYWSSRPGELIEGDGLDTLAQASGNRPPLPVPGGGLTTGDRPIHAGDAGVPGVMHELISDGQAYWRLESPPGIGSGHDWQWREFDPRTGAAGRLSQPAFLAAGPSEARWSSLRPAPAAFSESPLGWKDGLVGWRVSDEDAEGVDGRRVTVPGTAGRHEGWARIPLGAVSVPGADRPLPITHGQTYPAVSVAIWTPDGRHALGREVVPSSTLPPLDWWHALKPRDEKGSAALRGLDDRTAEALLDVSVSGTAQVRAAVEANLAAHLPAVTDRALLTRLADVVARAVRLRRRLASVSEHLSASIPERPETTVADDTLRRAWGGLCEPPRTYYYDGSGSRDDLLQQVRAVAAQLPDVPAAAPVWTVLLGGLGAVALRAASPVTEEAHRTALSAFLDTVAGTPLSGDGPPARAVEVSQSRMESGRLERFGTTVVFPPNDRYLHGGSFWTRTAIQIGSFDLPSGMTLVSETRPSPRWPGERLRLFTQVLAARGPAPWRPEAADALAAATGMTRAEAVLLLGGLPGIAGREANFLTPAQRAALGINAAQAKVAKASLAKLEPWQRIELLDAAMPSDPAALWEQGPDVEAVAAAWIRLRGKRIAVPEALVADLARVIDKSLAASVLQAIAAPADGDWLSTDGRTEVKNYHLRTTADSGQPFEGRHLAAVAEALPWLGYHLRWGDPLRAALPSALRLVRERLANPALMVGQGNHRAGDRPDLGPALVDGHRWSDHVYHHLVPAHLSGPDDPALGFIDEATADNLRVVLSDWIDAVVSAPSGSTGSPHDPGVSAPALIPSVASRFGLSLDAAAYYLQVLALPDPTDKAVQGWNGWKPARLKAAQQELVAAKLLVAAKRERAGRGVFLPGGWQPDRAPRLPMETWKQPLYPGRRVTRSLPELFAAAWARIVEGDVPRYRDLEEKP